MQEDTEEIELYEWPDLDESLGIFDSQDLLPNSVFLLKLDGIFRVIWVGHSAAEADLQEAVNNFPNAEIVHEGQETQAFWDLFVHG